MFIPNRKERILELLAQKNAVSIQELVSDLGVSESTLRRDLEALEEEGLLTRVHGGATTTTDIHKEQKMSQKENVNQAIKARVAKYAGTLVQPDSQIYVDAGTATLELVRVLPNDMNLQLVTNGVDHALLALKRGFDVILLGGHIKRNTHAIADMTAYRQLEKFNFSLSFMGMNGLHEKQGLTTTNMDEALLKECAMNQSQRIRILMDDSKVDQVYQFKVEAPTQAIILLNSQAKTKNPSSIEKLNEKFDLHFVEDNEE
jgi:DeoR family fructose operon transcriptional repressor